MTAEDGRDVMALANAIVSGHLYSEQLYLNDTTWEFAIRQVRLARLDIGEKRISEALMALRNHMDEVSFRTAAFPADILKKREVYYDLIKRLAQ